MSLLLIQTAALALLAGPSVGPVAEGPVAEGPVAGPEFATTELPGRELSAKRHAAPVGRHSTARTGENKAAHILAGSALLGAGVPVTLLTTMGSERIAEPMGQRLQLSDSQTALAVSFGTTAVAGIFGSSAGRQLDRAHGGRFEMSSSAWLTPQGGGVSWSARF